MLQGISYPKNFERFNLEDKIILEFSLGGKTMEYRWYRTLENIIIAV